MTTERMMFLPGFGDSGSTVRPAPRYINSLLCYGVKVEILTAGTDKTAPAPPLPRQVTPGKPGAFQVGQTVRPPHLLDG